MIERESIYIYVYVHQFDVATGLLPAGIHTCRCVLAYNYPSKRLLQCK